MSSSFVIYITAVQEKAFLSLARVSQRVPHPPSSWTGSPFPITPFCISCLPNKLPTTYLRLDCAPPTPPPRSFLLQALVSRGRREDSVAYFRIVPASSTGGRGCPFHTQLQLPSLLLVSLQVNKEEKGQGRYNSVTAGRREREPVIVRRIPTHRVGCPAGSIELPSMPD